MSFEAVPCRFRAAPGPQGEETEYIGLLIRPAGENSQQPTLSQVTRVAQPPVAPVRVIPAGEAQRLLVPANVQVRLAPTTSDGLTSIPMSSTWQPATTTRVMNTTFSSPPPNISSPCSQQPRSLSVCSSSPMTASSPMSPPPQQHYQQNGTVQYRAPGLPRPWLPGNDSSTTPDSGIQSVPGSPPSNHRDTPPTIEACSSVCEDRPEEEDFADMPRLIPIDQEEEEEFCAPGPSGLKEEHSTNGSECETTAPVTLSITPLMDNAKISEQLIQLDPAKAFEIAQEIHKRMGLQEKLEKTKKRRPVKKENPVVKKRRPNSAASDELKKSEEEIKEPLPIAASSPETRECPSPSVNFTPSDSRKLYREAVKRMMERQVVAMFEKTMMGLQELHIGERERHERRKSQKKVFSVDFEALKKRRKKEEDRVLHWKKKGWGSYKDDKKVPKEEVKFEETTPKKTVRKRKHDEVPIKEEEIEEIVASTSRRGSRTSVRTPSKRRNTGDFSSFDSFEKRPEMDFDEIPRSVCETSLPGWTVPTVRCGCTRGACTSDAECINRALFVQCSSNCQAHMCINKKFWREDAVRHLSASGPKSKRLLRTKVAKRAGDFLGEYAGEVISFEEAEKRWNKYKESEEIPRILSISSNLFVDATKMGNVSRYVRHSCRPNSRLEVWSINGHLRAGLFPLYDLAPNTEVTISMNGLLPVGKACTSCAENSYKCCRWVKRSRNAVLSTSEPLGEAEQTIVISTRPFLMRNRRKTIARASRSYVHRDASVPSTTKECLSRILDGLQLRIRNVDGSLPLNAVAPYTAVQNAVKSGDLTTFQSAVDTLLESLDDDDLDRVYSALSNHFLGTGEGKDKKHHLRNREVDLSYLDLLNTVKVGSYNPDGAWPTGSANKRADAVRCECGSLEEDGKMLQCDACNFWLHTDCIGHIDDNLKYYQCRLCSGVISDGIPSTDVKLVKQPELRFEGCTYYKALVNRRNIQVRQFETVYVGKTHSDDHKKILKKLQEVNEKGKKKKIGEEKRKNSESPLPDVPLDPPGHRKDLRIFRVERLFTAPGGHRFVFGFYYARPHETICDPHKMFHRNEVFATPFYDTLPLDLVVGRCAVLDPDVYISGRPTVPKFKEEDILVCDYQIDKQQRSFEKIPVRNRFPMNTQPYVFAKYETPRPLVRDFTPFVVGDRSSSRASGRVSRTEISIKEAQNKHRAELRLESVVSRLKNVTSSPISDGEAKPGRKRKRSHHP